MNQPLTAWLDELERIYVTHNEYPPATEDIVRLIAIARAAEKVDAAVIKDYGKTRYIDGTLLVVIRELHEALHPSPVGEK